MKKFKIKTLFKILYSFIILVVLVISVVTLLSVLGIPKTEQIFAVQTGSMEPNIPTGSAVFVTPQQSYQVGDVITYQSNLGQNAPKTYNVTHRITNISTDNGDTFYETKGDANSGVDPWTANNLDVLGRVNFQVPYLGYLVSFAKTKLGFVIIILTPALIVILLELSNIINTFKIKKQPKKIDRRDLYLNF